MVWVSLATGGGCRQRHRVSLATGVYGEFDSRLTVGAVTARAVAIGRAREQELVAVGALVLGHAVISAGLHEPAYFVERLEPIDGLLHVAGGDAGVLREGRD